MAGVKCPRCGLFNPETAQRCDCGYDFETRTVETAYFKQELPRQFKTYMVFVIVLNVIVSIGAIADGDTHRVLFAGVWTAVVWWLYSRLVAKRNWARIALVILTFPVGLLVGMSREIKLYCLQK